MTSRLSFLCVFVCVVVIEVKKERLRRKDLHCISSRDEEIEWRERREERERGGERGLQTQSPNFFAEIIAHCEAG